MKSVTANAKSTAQGIARQGEAVTDGRSLFVLFQAGSHSFLFTVERPAVYTSHSSSNYANPQMVVLSSFSAAGSDAGGRQAETEYR